MKQFIGCDAHKKYSVFVAVSEEGRAGEAVRVEHSGGHYRDFLEQLPVNSLVALEAGGHYYWLVDEIQRAGHQAFLANPVEAKKRMGRVGKKTDRADAEGLAILLRNGTLPTVWIPPTKLRDQRELLRLRMFLVGQRTQWKNRILGALARYNIMLAARDAFTQVGRLELSLRFDDLPMHTRNSVESELATLDFLQLQIEQAEDTLTAVLETNIPASVSPSVSQRRMLSTGKTVRELDNWQRFHT